MAVSKTFRDPIGLALRIARDPNPTARVAFARAIRGLASTPIDRMRAAAELSLLAAAPAESDHPMLLVIGAPRSGTTLVAQVLVHHLDVSFASNLGACFPRSPITTQLRRGRPPGRFVPELRNFYGQTRGLHDHNDAFHLWNRWLGTERYRSRTTIDECDVVAMRRFFAAWHTTFDRPFVNKNNRNTNAVPALAAALPHARFLVVERDREQVAESLRVARRLVHGDERRAWGLHARDAIDGADVDRAIADQLAAIDADLSLARDLVPEGRLATVEFAAFCRDPAAAVEMAAAILGIAGPKTGPAPISP